MMRGELAEATQTSSSAMNAASAMNPVSAIELSAVVVAVATVMVLLTVLIRRYPGDSPLTSVLRNLRNLVLPFGLGWYLLTHLTELKASSVYAKAAETLFWVAVIWVATGIVKLVFFARAVEDTWRARVPGLLVNLTQVTLIIVGAAMVVAGVWNRDLGALLTTLGVGSLVVGLALQDTLGNLFAGIALLFERPFSSGDWIGVGDLQGRVVNINWRAVHLVTRERDLHVVPNSVLGKEVIHNYSQPTNAHGVLLHVGFSYDDPPNEVKRMLRELCDDVSEVLPWGISVRTIGYNDFSVDYEVRFFIEDYLRQPEIQDNFMSRVWYATRRNGFTIPFPIRTVYHRRMPPRPQEDTERTIHDTLAQLPLFNELSPAELDDLTEGASLLEFGVGDTIVREGQSGGSMYFIRSGTVVVRRKRGERSQRNLAELSGGAYFGEMSLLTGEPRSASVVAKTDTIALMIPKAALSPLLEARPELVERFAKLVEERRKVHDDPTEFELESDGEALNMQGLGQALVGKIRAFFGLRPDAADPQ